MLLQTLACDLDPSVFSLTFLLAPCIELKLWRQKVTIYGMVTSNVSAARSVVSVCPIVVVAWAFISKKITGWRLPQR